ncbi:MAG TPA: LD-carboxypeptidase [Candidatus Binatia bacterium]|nr:LD-carboxypeptidase [Candidatus Binatia bacterium]
MVAPAGRVHEERLVAGARVLEGWGLRVVMGDAVLARQAYLAGPDDARRGDLQRMIDDPGIDAIFCARGGYGSQRIIPSLDLTGLVQRPKPVIGYSDITALLTAMLGTGVSGIHGPMVAADLSRGITDHSRDHLLRVLTDPDYLWEVDVPVEVRPGRATGRLVGGCLSVLVSLAGTPWAPDLDGTILFLEDTHEWPYRLDRLLTQLLQSGRLEGVAGVVFGTMASCRSLDGVESLDVVRERFADVAYPVAFGLASGHDPAEHDVENLALPLGTRVVLDTARGRLTALEPAVV